MTNINADRHQSFGAPGGRRVSPGAGRAGDPRRWKRSVAALAVASCFAAGVALANPVGPTVVSGQASFNRQGSQLAITNSTNAVIHWQSFSIGPAELTRFIQPSASSAVLNRVMGGAPSDILGALQSNGRVFLINPSGIVFGAGARIDVAGLVASTLNLTNEDFLSGRLRFTGTPGAGSVVNEGAIRTAPRGNVYLIAPSVENSGVITSARGEIILAAGRSVELVDVGTPDLRVQITAPDTAAVNLGSVIAQSGRIGIYAGLINQKGLVNADTVVVGENGRITFKAKDITLAPGSVTSASGAPGGVRDGGEVRIVADGTLDMQKGAQVHVDGGADGGNGGFLELSGKERIALNGSYTVRAQEAGYRGGELLLDPQNIRIVTGGGDLPPGTSAEALLSIDPANINQAGASIVTLTATNDLTVDSTITAANLRGGVVSPGAGTSLTLAAGNNATINAGILFDPDQNLAVQAGNGIATASNALAPRSITAGRIDFRATNGGITIGAGTTLLGNNNSNGAAVNLLAGTLTGTLSGGVLTTASGNAVNIHGTVQGSAPFPFPGVSIFAHSVSVDGVVQANGFDAIVQALAADSVTLGVPSSITFGVTASTHSASNTLDISGSLSANASQTGAVRLFGGTVNVRDTGSVVAATANLGGSAKVRVAALTNRTAGSGEVTNHSTANTATVSGLVRAATNQGAAGIQIAGGTVAINRGIQTASPNVEAVGLNADVAIAALSQGADPFVGGPPGFTAHTTGNSLTVGTGVLAANATGSGSSADVELRGGTISVGGTIDANGQGSGSVSVVAAPTLLDNVTTFEINRSGTPLPSTGFDIQVSGRMTATAGDIADVGVAGATVGISGRVEALGASQGRMEIAAVNDASIGQITNTANLVHGAGHDINLSGVVRATGAAGAFVAMAGDKVTVSGGTGANPNVDVAAGVFGGVLAVAAATSTTVGSNLTASTHNVTNAVAVSGWIRGTAATSGNADVQVLGGTVTLGPGSRLDAAGGFAFLEAAAASATTETIGPINVVDTVTFVPGNRVQVDAGATLGAQGTQIADVNLFGGSVSVAGDVRAFGSGGATIALAAASQFNETRPVQGPGQIVQFTHGAGHDVTVSGVVQAAAAGGSAQVAVVGDRVSVTGGTQASPNVIVSGSSPIGGVLAVAATTSSFIGSNNLTASTHDGTRNVVDVSGWIAGSAENFTLDVVGGSVNVNSGGGLQAGGLVGAEIAVLAVGSLTGTLGSPITFQTLQAGGNRATIGGTLTVSGNSIGSIAVLGGSVDIPGSGVVQAQGVASRVGLAAGATSDFALGPVVRLTGLTAGAANTLSLSGHVTAGQQVDLLGGAVTVHSSGQVSVAGAAPGAINVAAVDSYTADLAGNVTTTHLPGSLAQVDGTLAADSLESVGKVSILGGSVLAGGTVNADGAFDAGIEILAAGTASFAPGFVLTGFTATTANTVGVTGSLNAGLAGPFTSGIRVQGGQVNFAGAAQSRSDNASIFIAATSGPCSGNLCPSTSGMQVNLSGNATATGLNTARVEVSGFAINQTAGTLRADGSAGAEVKLFTTGGDITVGGLVDAQGGAFGEGIVHLETGPSSGNITVTGTGSLQAADAFGSSGSGCPPVCARVTALAPAGTVTINGSVLANNTATGIGGAFVDIEGVLGVTVNGSVSAQSTALLAGVGLNAPGGSVLIGSGGNVLAANTGATPPALASVALIAGNTGGIDVRAGASVAAVGQANASVSLDTLGGITVGGSVAGTANGASGAATVFLGGSGGAAFINVLAGGELEATGPAGGLVSGFANGDITIGGNIYGGIVGGGVILNAGGAIIGAGGTLDAGVGDTISLTAVNGIGAVGAPVRILDGEPRVTAVNSTSGDVVLSQVTGDMFFGPAGTFTAVSNAGPGGIELIAETGNADVKGLLGNGSFVKVAAAGAITSTGLIQNSVGSVFLQAPGGVTLEDATVSAQEDVAINGGPVTIARGERVLANRNLVIAGNSITVSGASLLSAGSNMGLTSLGNLTVEDSTITGGNGTGLFTATVAGDFIIRAVNDISRVTYFPDIGSPTLPVTIFGSLLFESTAAHPAVLESVTANSVYLFFPLLGSGGMFVNGVPQTSAGPSGIFADNVPAVPGTNLFVTYGGSGGGGGGVGGEVVQELVAPLTGYVNQATELAVPSGEQGGQQGTGAGDDDKKKKRPRNCS